MWIPTDLKMSQNSTYQSINRAAICILDYNVRWIWLVVALYRMASEKKAMPDTHDHLYRITRMRLRSRTIHFNAFQCHCTINVHWSRLVSIYIFIYVLRTNIIGSLFFDNIIGQQQKHQFIEQLSVEAPSL